MYLSIIIPTKDRPKDIRRLLTALSRQTFRDFEIIVIDESRNSMTKNICKEYEKDLNIKYFHVKLGSLTRARNFGLKHAKGRIIIFMDDDIIIPKDFLEKVHNIFETNLNIIGIQGLIISKRLFYSQIKNAIRKALLLPYLGAKTQYVRRSGVTARPFIHMIKAPIKVQIFYGCCFAFRKEIFNKVKFDENVILWSFMEDIDFSYTCYKLNPGKLLLDPSLKIYHFISPEARLNDRRKYYMSRVYWAYFFFKHHRNSLLSILAFIYAFFIGNFILRIIGFITNSNKKIESQLFLTLLKAQIDVLRYLGHILRGNLGRINDKIIRMK